MNARKKNKQMDSILTEGNGEIIHDDILANELREAHGPKGAPQGDPIMQVRDLHVSFATEAGVCRAVRGVNFDLWRGRTLGKIEEWFGAQLRVGDSFAFAGLTLEVTGFEEADIEIGADPAVVAAAAEAAAKKKDAAEQQG